jgi:hypothetical protein
MNIGKRVLGRGRARQAAVATRRRGKTVQARPSLTLRQVPHALRLRFGSTVNFFRVPTLAHGVKNLAKRDPLPTVFALPLRETTRDPRPYNGGCPCLCGAG